MHFQVYCYPVKRPSTVNPASLLASWCKSYVAVSYTHLLIFDAVTWVLDGMIFPYSGELLLVSMMIYYCLVPLPSLFWLLYTDVKLHADQRRLKKLLALYSIPCVVSTILVLTTLKTGWIFTISADGIYYRGPYMAVIVLLTYVYLGGALVMAVKARCGEQNTDRIKVCRYLIFFPIPTIILSFVQVELYGVTLIWICMAVSLIISFLNVQSEQTVSYTHLDVYKRQPF